MILRFLFVNYCLTKNHNYHNYCQCIRLCYKSQVRCNLWSFIEDFMLFVLYLKEYTGLLQCSIIENQRNVDDMITTNQIITIFTIKVGSLSEIFQTFIPRTLKKIGENPLWGHRYLGFYTLYERETCTKVSIFRSATI